MNEQIQIKQNIQANLLYGDLSKVAKIVGEKRNKSVSVSHVKNVLNPLKRAWDGDIIAVAQKLILERQNEVITAIENLV